MTGFLDWFFAFITTMFSGIWNGISALVKGLIHIFAFSTYFGLFSSYQDEFGVVGWVLAVFAMILVYAFWICIGLLIALGVRKGIRYYRAVKGNEDLLEEISILQKDLSISNAKKDRMIDLTASVAGVPVQTVSAAAAAGIGGASGDIQIISDTPMGTASASGAVTGSGIETSEEKKKDLVTSGRFYRLSNVDAKYSSFEEPPFDDSLSLSEMCDDLRNYACTQAHLYYDIKTIRLLIAGFSSTKTIILQGISGTGKTSFPYVFGKYLQNDATITPVQPSWRDRTELFGFFNEFTKKFNETEVLRRIYEASYTHDINIIVLDEMNISRVEYYFAEMLSVMEMPDPDEWNIQIVPSVWESDPKLLVNGNLHIPQNVWYIGTANNDDSTFSISDKVYDRALVVNLDKKGVPFDAPSTTAKRISYTHLTELYAQAQQDYPVSEELLKKVEVLDNYVIEKFRVAFGNRIMKQVRVFIPTYVACGGTDIEALDYLLATKVFRKFEGLNLSLIRDEIRGLISCLNELFGNDTMYECIAFLRRLQKSF